MYNGVNEEDKSNPGMFVRRYSPAERHTPFYESVSFHMMLLLVLCVCTLILSTVTMGSP